MVDDIRQDISQIYIAIDIGRIFDYHTIADRLTAACGDAVA